MGQAEDLDLPVQTVVDLVHQPHLAVRVGEPVGVHGLEVARLDDIH